MSGGSWPTATTVPPGATERRARSNPGRLPAVSKTMAGANTGSCLSAAGARAGGWGVGGERPARAGPTPRDSPGRGGGDRCQTLHGVPGDRGGFDQRSRSPSQAVDVDQSVGWHDDAGGEGTRSVRESGGAAEVTQLHAEVLPTGPAVGAVAADHGRVHKH